MNIDNIFNTIQASTAMAMQPASPHKRPYNLRLT